MNYAATLAVLMLLAFFFPLLVRLSTTYGVERSTTITTTLVLASFWFAVWGIRARVATHRTQLELLATARAQIESEPNNPRAFFADGEHVGLLLLRLGRRREASEMIDRYALLGGARESEIVALRQALARAERRRRRNA
ncbi:hypothetical protein [Deinococcus pimensis]|uniref:hypothetical protein n=1 Tax=Deinococcus pimensis TaxID=309888 RepID=UPI000480A5C6|nr:hypothetical protein [Deinococcus pimensis]